MILKNAVENNFTVMALRAQTTYSKDNVHLFGEDTKHTFIDSKP
jgi:hypothetical protein